MTKGTVFNIQKFSVNDGPGIRTTVFMKGCPLRCLWCHNPESKHTYPEIMYDKSKCSSCGGCISTCEKSAHNVNSGVHIYDRSLCDGCGKCAEHCVFGAIEIAGKSMDAVAVIEEVMRDKVFYDTSGGGMTLSGGEPMMQIDFTYELLSLAKEKGLHTCMETCGYAKAEDFKKIAPLVDIFLFDYKVTSPELHKKYTGVDNTLILDNLFMLDSMGAKTVLRCPIIPTCNDTEEHLLGIAEVANKLKNVIEINIEPYHPLGKGKTELLGKEYALSDLGFPNEETVKEWMAKVSEKTQVPVKKA